MEIVFVDSDTISLNRDVSFDTIEEQGSLKCLSLTNRDDIIPYCTGCDILITNKVFVGEDALSRLENLKLICVIATGYNNVDLDAARKYNKLVANVPGYARHSVPQHTFALLLNLATRAHLYDRDVKEGQWQKSERFNLLRYPCFELQGKSMGIIGFGTIGRAVARIAESFGMKVMAYDISDISHTGYRNTEFEHLIKNSDAVSIHCPLTQQTKNLIAREQLMMMKDTAVLINTARGSIVNEEDLAWALNTGQIAGAGIDVLSQEPPARDNPLLAGAKNLIITPHSAWSTREARQRLIDITAKNIASYVAGRPANIVS
ncbi:MAG: D-2-hydroxyacid dehydrogenase [Actinomycetota bacterium]